MWVFIFITTKFTIHVAVYLHYHTPDIIRQSALMIVEILLQFLLLNRYINQTLTITIKLNISYAYHHHYPIKYKIFQIVINI